MSHGHGHEYAGIAREWWRSCPRNTACRWSVPGAKDAGQFSGSDVSAERKLDNLVQLLEKLEPGVWLIVEHPGLDTPEMCAIGHRGYENVAEDRAGVTAAFTSERVKEVIRRRNIQLVSYGEALRDQVETTERQ